MDSNTIITRRIRRAVLLSAGETQANIRIVVVPGIALAPRKAGRSYYWTTPSGKTEVQHPSAYGWPTVYHSSTRRVEVGAQWLACVA